MPAQTMVASRSTPNVSPDLIWPMVRDTSCFVKTMRQTGRSKGGKYGPRLTSEPGNLTAINKFKWSGLANQKTVDITPAEKGLTLTTKTRKAKRVTKPNKLTNTVALSSNLKTAAKTIIAEIGTNFYRADLQSAALAKASALCKAAKKSK